MVSPLVTVFIPVYNAQDYIEAALHSIMNQSYTNLDILIIDDGSADDTLAIVNACCDNDNRIRILANERNQGIPYTRNRGLVNTRGDYLAVMDADDIAHRDRIREQVTFMEANPHIDAAGCNFLELGKRFFNKKKSRFYDPEALRIRLLFASPIANPSSIIRMTTVRDNNIRYNEDYFVAQDYDFWFKIAQAGQLGMVPQYLMTYRTGHNNISRQSRHDKAQARQKVIQAIHTNILDYYGFALDQKAYRDFMLFFDDGYRFSDEEIDIPELAHKLLHMNQRSKVFTVSTFNRVLLYSFAMNISNLDRRLIKKISLYFQLAQAAKHFDAIDLARIIAKHVIKRRKLQRGRQTS